MVSYRMATESDINGIAELHALSWQENYRGALSDDFLNHHAYSDRMKVWQERLRNSDEAMHVIVAEYQNQIVGFVCVFLNHSKVYGTLLDNLHVASKMEGKGIGRKLMGLAAKTFDKTHPDSNMYLWVLVQNIRAIKFYEFLGGQKIETVEEMDIGDRPVIKSRYHWQSVRTLVNS